MQKSQFEQFLQRISPAHHAELLPKFETFHAWLVRQNELVNLISRKTDPEDIWSLHFLDSLLPVLTIDFTDRTILDVGTGGGLPGIPLSLLYPNNDTYLLDSVLKKVAALVDAVQNLDLPRCYTLRSRLEELEEFDGFFNTIVCRSVRFTPELKKAAWRLLAPGGNLVLYKAQKLEDAELFASAKIHDISHPSIGTRKIVEAVKNGSLKQF